MPHPHINDDEVILRHIPGGIAWQAPPDGRIASTNFRLRDQETGLSVSRLSLTTPSDLMKRLGDPTTGSRIASAPVASVRTLGFDVVADPLPDDPGHSLICPTTADLTKKTTQRSLAKLFSYVDIPATA